MFKFEKQPTKLNTHKTKLNKGSIQKWKLETIE
jgi:hypothetical protein